jgi:hypothetical protein
MSELNARAQLPVREPEYSNAGLDFREVMVRHLRMDLNG